MKQPTWESELRRVARDVGKYMPEAYFYIFEALDFTLRTAKREGHVTGHELLEGIRVLTKERFGYMACPCRLAYGEKARDIDIVCPCYYRDPDIKEHGACFCALYVNEDWIEGRKPNKSIEDRRPPGFVLDGYSEPEEQETGTDAPSKLSHPVWRCKVCGYLAARDEPPGKCPICKASKDRFERFM